MLFEPLNTDPAPDEPVTRYIHHKRHFAAQSLVVRMGAFEPSRGPLGWETSIFRTLGLSRDAIWELGRQYVEPTRGPIRARAEISVAEINQHQLRVSNADDQPRHAIIHNWPEDGAARLAIEQELRRMARLELAPAAP